MQLKRGRAPLTVEREIDIDISREEVISILSQYIKRKMNTNKVRFDDLSVVAVKDETTGEMRLTGITLLGVETLVLQYPVGHAPVQVQSFVSPAALPDETTQQATSQLPPPLQALAEAAKAQAVEATKPQETNA